MTVTDLGSRLTDETSFVVTVMNVNDAPIFAEVGDHTVDEDNVLTITLSASDVDDNNLNFDLTEAPDWLLFDYVVVILTSLKHAPGIN